MRHLVGAIGLVLAVGCSSRDHIRSRPLPPEALVYVLDTAGGRQPVKVGDRIVVDADSKTLLVIEDIRQTRYPLLRGWHVERDDDSFTIEEVPTFKPY